MALSDDIQDAITRHQIFILRYAAGREKEASQYVDRVKEMIQDELRNEELTDLDLARLNRFMDEVQLFAEEQYQALADTLLLLLIFLLICGLARLTQHFILAQIQVKLFLKSQT